MMNVGSGTLLSTMPGAPGGLLDDTMGPMMASAYQAPPLDLERLATLFEGQRANDPNLEERQLKVMHKIVKHHADGLIIRDLPCIAGILTVGKEKVDAGMAPWGDAILPIVRLLGQPLVKLAASDELRSIQNLCTMAVTLGKMVACADPQISNAAGQSLAQFAACNKIRTLGEEAGEAMLQSSFPQRIIERCGIIPILVTILRDVETPETHLTIVKTFKVFSTFKENAIQIMASGAAELLVTLLTEDFTNEVVGVTLELLWNCLDFDTAAAGILGSWHTINTIKELLERLLAHGSRTRDKELLNESLILLKLIAHQQEARQYYLETALIELLVHLATAHELGWGDSYVIPFFRLNADEDFEAKQVVLAILEQLSHEKDSLGYMLGQDIMSALLQHCEYDEARMEQTFWKEVQEAALQLQACQMLFTIAPMAVKDFDEAGGFSVLLHLLSQLGAGGSPLSFKLRSPHSRCSWQGARSARKGWGPVASYLPCWTSSSTPLPRTMALECALMRSPQSHCCAMDVLRTSASSARLGASQSSCLSHAIMPKIPTPRRRWCWQRSTVFGLLAPAMLALRLPSSLRVGWKSCCRCWRVVQCQSGRRPWGSSPTCCSTPRPSRSSTSGVVSLRIRTSWR